MLTIRLKFSTAKRRLSPSSSHNLFTSMLLQIRWVSFDCRSFLQKSGIEASLHEQVVKELESALGKSISVADLEAFGASGLLELARSIEQQNSPRTHNRPSRTVQFEIPHHQTQFKLPWKYGESLLDVAKSLEGEQLLGEYMEGTCGGQMSCCTCHVYLDQATYDLLPEPDEAELDMLSLAYDPQPTSRLGCQVKYGPELLGNEQHQVSIFIPSDVNNVWK